MESLKFEVASTPENKIEKNIAAARAIFHGNQYAELAELPVLLHEILDCLNQEKYLGVLPAEVFEQIIGPEYLKVREDYLHQQAEGHGAYLPFEAGGGGDYLNYRQTGGEVGEIKLFDYQGHGEKTLWPKALMMRFLELRAQDSAVDPATLFADLDDYLQALPADDMRGINMLALMSVERVTGAEGQTQLTAEAAGDVRLVIRRPDGTVEIPQLNNYPPLGVGLLQAENPDRLLTHFDLSAGTAVFLSSDGLFDIKVSEDKKDPRRFSEIFSDFAVTHAGLSHGAFQEALLAYVQQAKQEKRVTDDVTILAL